ncbi:MAG: AlpA family transcriptional regulator [Pseudomonadota bacterium]
MPENNSLQFLRLPEVMAQTGMSRSSLYSLIKQEAFPKQIKLSKRLVAWVKSDVEAWMKQRITDGSCT